jgi:hypothetical protein
MTITEKLDRLVALIDDLKCDMAKLARTKTERCYINRPFETLTHKLRNTVKRAEFLQVLRENGQAGFLQISKPKTY